MASVLIQTDYLAWHFRVLVVDVVFSGLVDTRIDERLYCVVEGEFVA